jgi:NAD(P)-dependent dehydrogenase (short-subunit alcohol dehydrogenase family)
MSDAPEARLQTPSMRLDGQVAVVTGAGRGLGKGCAIALAEAGAEVVIIARNRHELDQVSADIAGRGGTARVLVLDVTDSAAVTAAFDELDRVDVLVNNAGTNVPEPFLEVSEANLDKLLDLNVRAAFLVAQAAARRMAARGEGGAIINMSSQMGRVGYPNRTVYCTTKHALEGLTKAMAVELAPQGIRVNAIGPTFIATPLAERFFEDPAFRDEVVGNIPLGHVGRMEDVMGAVVFLASPAAALITGASLVIDGGWTAI